ncbi:MAG: hypothetical protein IJG40_07905 [Oscillospiraceae bacterium]|nr:hypothetical protein [Oscillospiraceae bacterium]
MKRIQNFWYHYKTAAIIAAVIIAAGVYLVLQQSKTVKPDYEVAIVTPAYITEEQLSSLKDVLQQNGEDCSGDGSVVVNLRVYRIALGQDGQDSAVIGALDADLVGNVSGLFLLDDPGIFEETANGICKASEAVPVSGCEELKGLGFDGLFLSCRTGAEKKYAAMLEALTA